MTETSHAHRHPGPAGSTFDPVCGMTVDPHTTPHRHSYRGAPYYFCSAGCRSKFAADPEKYLANAPPHDDVPEGAIYTCPMHPEIRQVGTGYVPDLRHGARTGDRDRRHRTQSRTRRHDTAVLDRPRADRTGVCAGDGLAPPRRRMPSLPRTSRTGFSSRSPLRLCCGRAGHSSCAAGSRWSRAISTCSR